MDERGMPELAAGTNIHGAVIEERVGAGGHGAVYRARDEHTGTLFALKVIPLEWAEVWSRREPSLTPLEYHRNLAQQVSAGRWPLHAPRFMWLKLLYIEGRELDTWAREENPDARAVADKVMGVARGLAVVHAASVVHRDVKEANILVRDEDGEPVLVDFGAARGEWQSTHTREVFPPGTPLYRSPEAWRFRQEHGHERDAHYRPGKADDLYALGVVFYRLLTERYPFASVAGEPLSWEAILNRMPLPPHILNPRVPEALSGVCMRLMEKKPEDRYPSALALHDALKALLGEADAAWSVPLQDDGPRWELPPPGRTWRRVAVGAALAVGLALAGWELLERLGTAPSPVEVAPSPRTLPGVSGQEVAPSGPPPDSGPAAAPRRFQEEAMKKPKARGPEGDSKRKGAIASVPRWCVGMAAAAQAACTTAPVRPTSEPPPQPEECPAGAFKTMKDTLHLYGDELAGIAEYHQLSSQWVPLREGPTSIVLDGEWGELPYQSRLSGRVYYHEGRTYGRFTEVQTPKGDTFKVCLEMFEIGGTVRPDRLGYSTRTEAGSNTIKMFSRFRLRVVGSAIYRVRAE